MADNFLEKQMEAYRNGSGRTVIRRDNPSLDKLIRITAEKTAQTDPEYILKQAQLDAAVRSASAVPGAEAFRFDTDEKTGTIRLLGPTSPQSKLLVAGEIVLALRLKAAELGFGTEVKLGPESAATLSPLVATVKLFR